MNVKHRGFVITEMVGGMSAEINDDGQYVEVVLIGAGDKRSFDREGLESFLGQMDHIRALSVQVDNHNERAREQDQ